MENKQKALEMAAAMQQKEKSGSLLWCVAEDLKATIQSMNEEEAKVIVADLEAGTHDLKTCEKAIHDYANKHKSGGSACCPGPAVPGILLLLYSMSNAEVTCHEDPCFFRFSRPYARHGARHPAAAAGHRVPSR